MGFSLNVIKIPRKWRFLFSSNNSLFQTSQMADSQIAVYSSVPKSDICEDLLYEKTVVLVASV